MNKIRRKDRTADADRAGGTSTSSSRASRTKQSAGRNRSESESGPEDDPVRRLQRRLGNQAIQRLVAGRNVENGAVESAEERDQASARPVTPVMRAPASPSERRGDTTPDTDRAVPCPRCLNRQRSGRPLDCPECERALQRTSTDGLPHQTGRSGDHLERVESTIRRAGTPLDPVTRQVMEGQFGHDFGTVRVHDSAAAAGSARAIGARAYTVGSDIVFGRGEFAPATASGRQLLAHELAHVIQQSTTTTPQGKLAIRPAGDAFEREADTAASAVVRGRPARVQRRTDDLHLARERVNTREETVSEGENREVLVNQIIKAGVCRRVPEPRGRATGGFRGQEAYFEATYCRGGMAAEAAGSADFSDVLDSVAESINRASRGDPGGAEDTLRQATVSGDVDLALQFDTLRLELRGDAEASVEEQQLDVQGVVRYSRGQFRVELLGSHEILQNALENETVSRLQVDTDLGPVEIRLAGSRTAETDRSAPGAGPTRSERFTFDGTVRYRFDDSGLAVGPTVSVENDQVSVGVAFTFGGRVPAVQEPDCFTCVCTDPEITYVCSERTRESEGPSEEEVTAGPPGRETRVPLFFQYERAEPSDWGPGYQETLDEIVALVQQGYTVTRIEGRTSPEGPLRRRRPGGFENVTLAQQRAERAHRDLQARIAGRLMFLLRDSPQREHLEAVQRGGYDVEGHAPEGDEPSAELFGSTEQGEVPDEALVAHLWKELGEPTPGEDPLAEEHVLGEGLPPDVREAVAAQVAAFRSGREGGLDEAERSEHLFRVLRRALVVLEPPARRLSQVPPVSIQESLQRIYGEPIPCEDHHEAVFNGIDIPRDWLFENRCSEAGGR